MRIWTSIVICLLICSNLIAQSEKISGLVYLDENSNGKHDQEERRLPNVAISNGLEVVQTDGQGKYQISLRENGVLFVIKPPGYIPAVNEHNISQFFAYHKPEGSPNFQYEGLAKTILGEHHDFALRDNPDERELTVALLGDTQVEIRDDVYYVAKLVGDQLMDEEIDFVVPLGDLVFDDLDLFDPLKRVLGKVGAPVYYVYGNHDRNYDATELDHRDETYEAHFGPSYYAFEYGSQAFIVLNNVLPENGTRYFEGSIDPNQLAFIGNYLKTLPSDKSIYLFMHIPLEEMSDKEVLFEKFRAHPNVTVYAGHTHTQYFKEFDQSDGWMHDQPLTELVAGAVCGAWWLGDRDPYGVPISMMGDGTPRGYWLMDIEDTTRSFTYRLAGNVPDKQMNIWTPYDFIKQLDFPPSEDIIVNVFAGNESTELRAKIGSQPWTVMQKVAAADPYYSRMVILREQAGTPEDEIPYYRDRFPLSEHIWKVEVPAELDPGVHVVHVTAKNNQGLDAHAQTLLFVN